MLKTIKTEIEYLLHFYCRIFSYKEIYLFPSITGKTIKPILAIHGTLPGEYEHAEQIQWLNFFQEIITRESMAEHTSIQSFMNHFNLDIVLPIRSEKRCLGLVGITTNTPHLKKLELQIAEFIMSYLSQLWKNIELLYHVRRSSEQTTELLGQMTTLMEISRAIEGGRDIQSLLEFIMEQCIQIIRAEAGSILLMNEDEQSLEFKVALGPKGKNVKSFKVPIGQGIAGWVAEHREPLLIPDAYSDNRFDPSFDSKSGFVTKSILCVPLIHHNKILGVVQALNRLDGQAFNTHDQQVLTIFATQAALAIENSILVFREIEKEAMLRDLKVASEIQRLTIPNSLPQNYTLEICGIHIPSQDVGGDYYSVFPVNSDEIIFCIADVAGKGISGALLVSTLHASLRAYLKYSTDLIKITDSLNKLIMELSTPDKFITLFLAKYNKKTSVLEYINAGHNPPFLLRKDRSVKKLKTAGISIGIIEFEYKTKATKLEKNDLLVLYTDGVTETADEKNVLFGEERLLDIVFKNFNESCSMIQDKIISALALYRKSSKLSDDLTLVVVKK